MNFNDPVHKVCGKYMAVSPCFWRSLRQTPSVKKLWLLGEKKSRWSGKGSKFTVLCWIKPWWFILTDYQSVASYTCCFIEHSVFLSLKCLKIKLCQFSSVTLMYFLSLTRGLCVYQEQLELPEPYTLVVLGYYLTHHIKQALKGALSIFGTEVFYA